MAAAGVAPVRERFVTSKEQFHAYLRANGELGGQEGDREEEKEASSEQSEPPAKRGRLDVQGQDGESPGEPEDGEKESRDGEKEPEDGEKEPVERKRARGQNKSRPCMKPNHYEKSRLCPSVTQGCADKCYFGPRCRFLHDVGEYMAAKPADLGPSCVLFETFGKCPYGITCRFAKAHLGDGYQNVVNTELAKQWEGKSLVRNNLSKDLQHQLRKKKFTFKKADEYLCSLAKPHHDDRKGGKAPGCSAEGEEVSNCTTPEDGLGDPSQCPVLPEGGDSKPAPVQSPQPTESRRGCPTKTAGPVTDEDIVKLRSCEKKKLEIQGKLYLAPLTTCGNLPFRRICKRFGADVTCGEMAVCTNLLQGQSSEWALLKRHHTEDIFGVQLEGAFPDTMTKCAELLNQTIDVDFVDINVGCPIDLVYKKGGGCALMTRSNKFEQIVRGMNSVSPTTGLPAGEQQVELNCFSSLTLPSLQVLDVPLTVKIRTGVQEKMNVAHKIIPKIREWGASMVTLHGRSREQRYTRVADWDYIAECAKIASPMPLFGNGDILSYEDADQAMQTGVSGIMIARGALIKPWLFTEIKEQRHWDISSSERFDILKDFTNYGLEHWGSDTQGVEKTRKFLLEWLSFLCRYIPVGLLERLPQKINERPPYYIGRDYLETLMASQNVDDWIKISELLLGPVPTNFTFLPKHKANSYR
ncbi:tRNA-dihydrouridine(47) synthase [NAD(P)(+)]-like isoform X1 [Centrocercus urophasianus]|uniref:tRNA-dihydrouridine(47) synthase [NAD(P)(+)]-like isoform X1 n=1 Tax=Centrocercus urophasianus TaxID=9002 RepID=UPI001C645C76|nr:tRNA-dihydrouridine(47) synthase [NAD(P)(+)]-like isoform X1 [Centrocercus urophasianus]